MTVSVCIPMYNESACVRESAEALHNKMTEIKERRGADFELIFCDDGSTDGSADILAGWAAGKDGVKLVGYPDNRGKGNAVKTAVLSSAGDVVIFTDCDLAYGVDVIERALDKFSAEPECDVVVGSRNLDGTGYASYGFLRKIASKIYIKVLTAVGGLDLSDSQCGFKAFRGDAAREIFSYCECPGFAFDYEVLMLSKKLGKKISEMPVSVVNHGKSSVHVVGDSLKMLRDMRKIKRRTARLDLASR